MVTGFIEKRCNCMANLRHQASGDTHGNRDARKNAHLQSRAQIAPHKQLLFDPTSNKPETIAGADNTPLDEKPWVWPVQRQKTGSEKRRSRKRER
jgi:hypothetical protein